MTREPLPARDGRTRQLETAVMDRFEADVPIPAIAAELGVAPGYVVSIVERLRVNPRDLWMEDARRGSALLLAAIRRYQARHEVGR